MCGFGKALSRLFFFLFITGATIPVSVCAGESPFAWTYTTDVQPKGTWELEQWATVRVGKQGGKYRLGEYRTEIEYGVTDNFQVAYYLNTYSVNASATNRAGETAGPYVPENIDKSQPYRRGLNYDSSSLEFIWRLMNPYTDAFGLALYYEPKFGPQRKEHEFKLLLQKNFLDDRLVLAGNIVTAYEWNRKTGDPAAAPTDASFSPRIERAAEVNYWLAASYRFRPKWFAGAEFWNHREFNCHTVYKRECAEHSAYFLGPTVHYAEKNWWVTISLLHQLPQGRCYNAEQCNVTSGGRIYGDEHERNMFRFKVGIPF